MYNQLALYVVEEASSYFMTHFLTFNICTSHGLLVYIAVDILLYPYALPIDHIPYSTQVFA